MDGDFDVGVEVARDSEGVFFQESTKLVRAVLADDGPNKHETG